MKWNGRARRRRQRADTWNEFCAKVACNLEKYEKQKTRKMLHSKEEVEVGERARRKRNAKVSCALEGSDAFAGDRLVSDILLCWRGAKIRRSSATFVIDHVENQTLTSSTFIISSESTSKCDWMQSHGRCVRPTRLSPKKRSRSRTFCRDLKVRVERSNTIKGPRRKLDSLFVDFKMSDCRSFPSRQIRGQTQAKHKFA